MKQKLVCSRSHVVSRLWNHTLPQASLQPGSASVMLLMGSALTEQATRSLVALVLMARASDIRGYC